MNAVSSTATKATESNAAEQAAPVLTPAERAAERLKSIPTVKLHEAEVADLCGEQTSNPRKYDKAHTAAVAARMPTQQGWKYSAAMFVPGTTSREFRAGSVFGTIVDLVKRAGRAGIPSYELATQLRLAQIGNKRSHYCEKLPPVGWAEGYINSAVQQGLVNQHATKRAPALVAPPAPAAEDKGTGTNG
jgi:hypothetical protein